MKCSAVYVVVFVCVLGTKESSATFEKDSAIDGSTYFLKSLLKNVENYKQIHFTWNIRNLNREQFLSLRIRENEDENLLKGINAGWNSQSMDYINIFRDNTTENKPPQKRYSTKLREKISTDLYQTTPYGYKEALYSKIMKTVTPDLSKRYLHSAVIKKSDSSTENKFYSQSVMDSSIEVLNPQIMRLVDKIPEGKRQLPNTLVQRSDSRSDKELSLQSEKDRYAEVSSPQIMRLVIEEIPDGKRQLPNSLVERSDSRSEKELSIQPEKDSNEEVPSPQIMRLVIEEIPDGKRQLLNSLVERSDSRSEKELSIQSEKDSNEKVPSPQIMRLVIDIPDVTEQLPNVLDEKSESMGEKDFFQSEIETNAEVSSPQIMRLVIEEIPDGKRQLPNYLVERSDSRSEKELSFQSEKDSNEEVPSPQIMRYVIDIPDATERLPTALDEKSDSRGEKDFFQSEIESNAEVMSPRIKRRVIDKIPDENGQLLNAFVQRSHSRSEEELFFRSVIDSNKEESSPQIMRLVTPAPLQAKRTRHNSLVKRTEVRMDKDTQEQNDWFTVVNNLVKKVPTNSRQYYETWKDIIKIFANNTMSRETYIKMFPKRANSYMIEDISQSNTFLSLFWPLVFENAFMNQKLGLLGLSGKRVPRHRQKLTFFQELEKVSTIKVLVNENKILLSFNVSDLVEGLNRAGLLESSLEFVEAGHHLFTTKEQLYITQNVNAAMDLINKTSNELYWAINQLIGCIAFYKAERPGYAGGTISSALGVTWQDPRFYEESSTRYYAEQIVHEFIHTSLFLADLVHGLYIDHRKFSEAKVYSPIRKTLRNYDKTFHASYVGTGLVAFHARAGHWDRVEKFAAPLLMSIDELILVNKEFGVLTETGEATLDAMVDFLTLIRLRSFNGDRRGNA